MKARRSLLGARPGLPSVRGSCSRSPDSGSSRSYFLPHLITGKTHSNAFVRLLGQKEMSQLETQGCSEPNLLLMLSAPPPIGKWCSIYSHVTISATQANDIHSPLYKTLLYHVK